MFEVISGLLVGVALGTLAGAVAMFWLWVPIGQSPIKPTYTQEVLARYR